jgi:hypothetical protein
VSLINKRHIKEMLGDLPLAAELYWQIRQQGRPIHKSYSLSRLERALPLWQAQARAARQTDSRDLHVMVFTTLHYWMEHAALLGVALAGLGHKASLVYLPYTNYRRGLNRFDLRRHNAYTQKVFRKGAPLLKAVSLLNPAYDAVRLPQTLQEAVDEVAVRDTQYTLQVEDIDRESDLFRLRLARDSQAARASWEWMRTNKPDVMIVPNGSILEMGAAYQAACHLNIPVVSYEFGEQRGRIWLAQNREVMRQDTTEMWEARKDLHLPESSLEQIRTLFASRQQGNLWENFTRRWQGSPSQGGLKARTELGLDERPIVLLAANVIGDSLTLGRQVFSDSMTEWLSRTVKFFTGRPEVQLVVRIHPGERFTKGPSVADVVRSRIPEIPEHFRLVGATDPVNTYDLVEIASLGLVYTTTAGMEMAMSGVPVIVAGQTHYRGKGFTFDPLDWDDYFSALHEALLDPGRFRLAKEQVETAWKYAYRFFFEYPCPFPWHLLHFWNELEEWPVARLLSEEGREKYGKTLRYLVGEPREWRAEDWQASLHGYG